MMDENNRQQRLPASQQRFDQVRERGPNPPSREPLTVALPTPSDWSGAPGHPLTLR